MKRSEGAKNQEPAAGIQKKGKKPRRSYPMVTLEEALKIPQAIKAKNNGHPWESTLVAKACGMTHMMNKFFYPSSAARDYGLTIGTRETKNIELTDLGRAIVYADDPNLEAEKKIEAFFKIDKFRQVYDHYSSSNLPEEPYLSNALESKFQIPTDQQSEFVEVVKANCTFLRIEDGLKSSSRNGASSKSAALEFRTLGKPEGEFDKLAFVIMPFSEKGKQVWRRAYYATNHERIQTARASRQELRREHFTEQALAWQRANKTKVSESKKKHRTNTTTRFSLIHATTTQPTRHSEMIVFGGASR